MALKEKSPLPITEGITAENFMEALGKNLDAASTPEVAAALQRERMGNPQMLGPRVVDPESWAEDMISAAQNKADKWLRNSLRPKKDPKQQALKAKGKWKNKMQEAIQQGNWEKGIQAVDETMRNQMIEQTGTAGYSSGVSRKAAKVTAKVKRLQPLVAALAETLDKMPIDTPEQRAAKMIAARDGMQAIKKRLREGG